jgi:hypothetical protein
MGAIGSGPKAPGVPQEPDPYEDMDVLDTYILGAAVIGTLYENGDLVVSGSGAMDDYTSNDAPFGTSDNPNTSIKKVIIKDGVTTVGDYAFLSCTSLTSVTIPDSVTSIGYGAFGYCTSLTSITIPDSVTSLGGESFWGCSSLTSITIPDSVTSLGDRAFDNCSGLTSVTIGNSVTSIGDWAFAYCSSLTSITIPDSVTSIGDQAFRGCSSLTEVYFEGNAPDDYGTNIFYNTPSTLTVYWKSGTTGWGATWGHPARATALWED